MTRIHDFPEGWAKIGVDSGQKASSQSYESARPVDGPAVRASEQHAAVMRRRRDELTRLGDEIAARRDQRDAINEAIRDLRARERR